MDRLSILAKSSQVMQESGEYKCALHLQEVISKVSRRLFMLLVHFQKDFYSDIRPSILKFPSPILY